MSLETLFAVVDQGSSSTKGALISERGRARYETRLSVSRDVAGHSVRHDAEELAHGVEVVLGRLLRQAPQPVAAIGLTCQRSTCLLWDKTSGQALTPALSWQDRTEARRAKRLRDHARLIRRRTGLPLSPHYAALKLSRLLRRQPGGLRRARLGTLVAGTLDAFLVRRLTGHDLTEPGHAGRTLCFDLGRGSWDGDLCRLFGIPEAALPRVVASAGERGTYRGVPVTAVAGDQQAALLGHGGWRNGVTAVHFGTGAFVLASTGATPVAHKEVLSAALATTPRAHRFQAEGSVNSAGSAVDWACALTGQELAAWKRTVLDPERLPLVLPTFAGAATPWWRSDATAVVAGLGLDTDGEALLGGVLFGVAMRVLDCVEALGRAGVATRVLRLSGKLTRLQGLVGVLADAGQLPVEVTREEMGLLGIARLAAAGRSGSSRSLGAAPEVRRRRAPRWEPAKARRVRAAWRRFARAALTTAERI
jgi:glycerol kinase